MDRKVLERKPLAELREIASTLELRGYHRMRKADLIDLIVGTGDDAGSNGSGNGARSGRTAETPDGDVSGAGSGDARPTRDDEPTETRTRDRSRARVGDTERGSVEDGVTATRVRTRRDPESSGDGRSDDGAGTGGDGDERGRTRARSRNRDGGDGGGSGRDGGRSEDETSDRPDGSDGGDTGRDRDTGSQQTRDGGGERDHRQGDRTGQRDKQGDRGGVSRDGGGQDRNRSGGNRDRSDDQSKRNKRDRRRKGRSQQESLDDAEVREGVLDLLPEGYGFLRTTGYLAGHRDVYVSQSFVRRFNLRRGDRVQGPIRQNKGNDKFPALGRIDAIEGVTIDNEHDPRLRDRVNFGDLTPLFPDERLRLETAEDRNPISMRIVDMMAPIGKGQRGLIVSPPKAGKTTILKQLAHAIETNNPEVHLMVLLVDERPEEVTDFERSTKGDVISSTFDRPADDHTQVAELCIERAKRQVERGRDVVILLDSITRLGRAYNLAAPASGRILSGGIDSAALYPPKRFFGAARNIEGGGSLTIIATALVETGSKMDEVIFEEFKGTGNMELRLDRRMEQKRIFPAIDIQGSGTRREELLLEGQELETVWKLRRLLSSMDSDAALQLLIDKLRATRNNHQFLSMIAKSNLG